MAQVQVFDASGKNLNALTLSNDVLLKDINTSNFSSAVRVLMQSWRQGTVSCKNRGEVSFSNKKPWKQKGTGRARAGRASSPLWRKGGVAFGPQPRVRSIGINKKQKTLVFNNLLSTKLNDKSIFCLDFESKKDQIKTKEVHTILESMGLMTKKVLLFLPFDDFLVTSAFRNIGNVNISSFDSPNVYALSNADCWVFLKKDVNLFEEMIAQWN